MPNAKIANNPINIGMVVFFIHFEHIVRPAKLNIIFPDGCALHEQNSHSFVSGFSDTWFLSDMFIFLYKRFKLWNNI
jgi:hypothetical protein